MIDKKKSFAEKVRDLLGLGVIVWLIAPPLIAIPFVILLLIWRAWFK